MGNGATNIYEMIRRALSAQVDLGMGEMVVNHRPQQTVGEPQVLNDYRQAFASGPADLFGSAGNGPPAPKFESLDAHREAIADCQDCPLWQERNSLVYGAGNPRADVMFVGEAPGADEDRLGEPFVGRAGKLLDRILAAIEMSRRDVYIANILKCRPPGNRDPQPAEMEKCFPHLKEQVALIRPRIICALGRISAQALLETTTPLGRLRGRWHEYQGVPLIATYHPAALLRFPAYKKDTWQDMQMLKARCDKPAG